MMKTQRKLHLFLAAFGIILMMASCKKEIYGCTDASASNHSTEATSDDGSCIYPNVSREDIILYVSDFNGSNGYFTTSFQSSSISESDVVFCEWQASGFNAFEALPKTYDDFMMVAYTRNGSNLTMEVSLYNTSNDLYDQPYFDWISGSTLRVYTISQRALINNGIDPDDTEATIEFIKTNIK